MGHNLASELNGGDDEDEALRRAIALSMGQVDPLEPQVIHPRRNDKGAAQGETIDLRSESPDDCGNVAPSPGADTSRASTSFSTLGLDRKQMEQERLARIAKRKATDAGVGQDERPQQRPRRLDSRPSGINSPHLGRATAAGNAPAAGEPLTSRRLSPQRSALQPQSGLARPQFPHGVVKRTWLRGQPKTPHDITIEEVLQKDSLEMAVLSSFQWDTDWLWRKINPVQTKTTLVAFAGNEAEKAAVVESASGIARLCIPPMNGMGSMHSKLQLLKFPGYLRVVVPSGNLVAYDWGETGAMENVVFIIDLPQRRDMSIAEIGSLTYFGEELCYFLKAQGLEESLIKSLRKYDFSQTARYGFVHTIAGSHSGDSWKRTGYCGLGRTVQNLGMATENGVEIDFVSSSIGSLSYGFLAALYNACQGDSGMKEYESRAAKSKSSKDSASSGIPAALGKSFRIYFPSLETVEASRGGRMSAGTICMQCRWWNLPNFPRELFRDSTNPRRALVHSKIIFVRVRDCSADWAYVGSANLSESAWGKLVKDRVSSSPKMSCRNWECGVIVPAGPGPGRGRHEDGRTVNSGACGTLDDVFKGSVPLPMDLPGIDYVSGNGERQPWFFDRP